MLMREDRGLNASEICRRILKVAHISDALSQRIIAALIGGDRRFVEREENTWAARAGVSILDSPIESLVFAVVDVETTGSRPDDDRVTDVGAVKIERGEISGTFQTLINPGRPIPPEIVMLTGINDELVRGAPPWSSIGRQLLSFLDDSVIVAHNAPFDLGFINHELVRAGMDPLSNPHLCTVRLSRKLLKGLANHKLDSLAIYHNLPLVGRHRGLGDALITAKVFLAFLKSFKEMGLNTFRQVKELEGGPV